MTLRLFIAIELDHAGKRAVGKLVERLGRAHSGQPGKVRWCGPEQMHLTLNFLGDTPAELVPQIAEAMRQAAAGVAPFPFGLQRVGAFPGAAHPRVIWVGIAEPTGALLRLQAALTAGLAGLGFAAEGRPFSPHITLARVKLLDERYDYESLLGQHADFAGPEQEADKLLLISSDLTPAGPQYTTVASVPLGKMLDAGC